MAPDTACPQIKQIRWGPERTVKCLQDWPAGKDRGALESLLPQNASSVNQQLAPPPSLMQGITDPMDQDQSQGISLTSSMNWDRDGELCSEDLEHLLARLQTHEVNPRNQETTVGAGADLSL